MLYYEGNRHYICAKKKENHGNSHKNFRQLLKVAQNKILVNTIIAGRANSLQPYVKIHNFYDISLYSRSSISVPPI